MSTRAPTPKSRSATTARAKTPAASPPRKAPAKEARTGAQRARPAASPKGPKVAKVAVTPKPVKPKAKLVRDSFTMPQADFALVGMLKERALDFKRPTKKSELLRAGLQALSGLDNKALHAALEALVPLKSGRPKKGE